MKRTTLIVAALLWAGVALGSWYDDYDAGIDAERKGQWATVIQKMTAAINGNPKENDRTRTYGAIFITYHPYYYRAVAYLNTGRYQQAVSDLEKTSGKGEDDLGSIDELMRRAKTKLAEASAPPPVETPVQKPPVVSPTATQAPALPSIDSALRNRARASLDQAKTHIVAAQQRKATGSQQYQSALTAYTEANTRLSTVRSNDDLNAIITQADNITLLADSAQAASVAVPPTVAPHPVPSRPERAVGDALAATRTRLRHALESYFAGDFGDAAQQFESLTRDLPNNGWIWAFLGASQYSQYAFEGEDSYKTSAMESFKKAKTFGKWRDGLPQKYFSRKIRKAFQQTAG